LIQQMGRQGEGETGRGTDAATPRRGETAKTKSQIPNPKSAFAPNPQTRTPNPHP